MAIPTIASISPASGPAGGRNIIYIAGTNFRLPNPPPAVGPTDGILHQTVRVLIGGEPVRQVWAVSATEIRVEVPAHRTANTRALPILPVAVSVTNLDDAGAPIPGENCTLAASYTYLHPPQRAPRATADNQRYKNIIENVVALFRRQVHPNTELADVSVDYGEPTVTVTKDATLPSISLRGPELIRDDWRTTHHTREAYNVNTGRWDRIWPPWTYMMRFTLSCLSDKKHEGIALMQAVIELFMRNGFLWVDRVPSDPSQGRERFPMHLVDAPQFSPQTGDADLNSFLAVFDVRGVTFELPEPFASVESVTDGEIEVQKKEGAAYVEVKDF